MIIELSQRFAQLTDDEWRPHLPSLESCLMAHRQGWHIFAPSRAVVLRLLQLDLPTKQKALLENHIAPKLPELLGQARASSYTIMCLADQEDRNLLEERQCPVQFSEFADLENIQKARLLVEDQINDGDGLKLLIRISARELGFFGPVALEVVHGGGGRVSEIFSRSLGDIRPLVCVVDSDKCHSKSQFGVTASQIMKLESTNSCGTVRYEILSFRELENYLPLSFLFDVFANDRIVRERISCFYRYLSSHPSERTLPVMGFVDLKSGYTEEQIDTLPPEIKVEFGLLEDEFRRSFGERGIKGISKNIIPMTIRLLDMSPRFEASLRKKFLGSPTFDHLRPILTLVLSFGASMGRLPIEL